MTDVIVFLVVLGILIFIGILIGILLAAIFRTPKRERRFYIIGQGAVFSLVAIWIYFSHVSYKDEFRRTENIIHNRHFIGLIASSANQYFPDQAYKESAFHALERSFDSPNDFYLTFSTSVKKDTLLASGRFMVSYIYFAYLDASSKEYFSKVAVLPDTSLILLLKGDADSHPEFKSVRQESEKYRREHFQELERDLEALPDSTKRKVRDILRETSPD